MVDDVSRSMMSRFAGRKRKYPEDYAAEYPNVFEAVKRTDRDGVSQEAGSEEGDCDDQLLMCKVCQVEVKIKSNASTRIKEHLTSARHRRLMLIRQDDLTDPCSDMGDEHDLGRPSKSMTAPGSSHSGSSKEAVHHRGKVNGLAGHGSHAGRAGLAGNQSDSDCDTGDESVANGDACGLTADDNSPRDGFDDEKFLQEFSMNPFHLSIQFFREMRQMRQAIQRSNTLLEAMLKEFQQPGKHSSSPLSLPPRSEASQALLASKAFKLSAIKGKLSPFLLRTAREIYNSDQWELKFDPSEPMKHPHNVRVREELATALQEALSVGSDGTHCNYPRHMIEAAVIRQYRSKRELWIWDTKKRNDERLMKSKLRTRRVRLFELRSKFLMDEFEREVWHKYASPDWMSDEEDGPDEHTYVIRRVKSRPPELEELIDLIESRLEEASAQIKRKKRIFVDKESPLYYSNRAVKLSQMSVD